MFELAADDGGVCLVVVAAELFEVFPVDEGIFGLVVMVVSLFELAADDGSPGLGVVAAAL